MILAWTEVGYEVWQAINIEKMRMEMRCIVQPIGADDELATGSGREE